MAGCGPDRSRQCSSVPASELRGREMNLEFPHETWRALPSGVWSKVLDLLTPVEVNWLLLGTSGLVVPADSVNSTTTDLCLRTSYWLDNRHRFVNSKLRTAMNPRLWLSVPADAWSVVLNYLKVSEVDRLLLSTSGQVVPDDAINTTAKVVNLVKPSCFLTAGRFVGAKIVRIPCLAEYRFTHWEIKRTNPEVAAKIVPLVVKMKGLENLYIGATCIDMGEWIPLDPNDERTTPNAGIDCCCQDLDVISFRQLVGGLVDAFRDGHLSKIKHIQLLDCICRWLCGGTHKNGCKLCRDVLRYFPLSSDLLSMPCCYSLRKKVPIILSRPDGRDKLNTKEFAISVLKRRRMRYYSHDSGYEEYDEEGQIVDWYPPSFSVDVVDFRAKDQALLEDLVHEIGFDPTSLSAQEVEAALGCHATDNETEYHCWLFRSAYDRLVALGFQFNIKPGTIRSWIYHDEDIDLQTGIHIQPDDTFEYDVKDVYCRKNLDLDVDSSDDEEDIKRKAEALLKVR